MGRAAALPPPLRWGRVGAPGEPQHLPTSFRCRSRNLQCQRIFQVNAPINCVCLHPNQVSAGSSASSQLTLPALLLGNPGGCGVLYWQLQQDMFPV